MSFTGQRHTKANANYLNSFSLIFTGDGMTETDVQVNADVLKEIKKMRKSLDLLTRLYYDLAIRLIPEVEPTKEELEAIKKARREKLIPLEELDV